MSRKIFLKASLKSAKGYTAKLSCTIKLMMHATHQLWTKTSLQIGLYFIFKRLTTFVLLEALSKDIENIFCCNLKVSINSSKMKNKFSLV